MFLALLEKIAESDPADTDVICQDIVFEPPADKLPTLTVGVVIVKRPFCELRLAETLDKMLFRGWLTVFVTTAVIVAVWPTLNDKGTCPGVMVRV